MAKSSVELLCFIWISNLSISLREKPTTSMFMISGVAGSLGHTYSWIWIYLIRSAIQEICKIMCEHIILEIPRIGRSKLIGSFGKNACRTIPTIRLMHSWKYWIWDQYLPETRHGILVIWDQYLLTNIKSIFANCELLKLWNFEHGINILES